jgi:molecular chaperone IbpA
MPGLIACIAVDVDQVSNTPLKSGKGVTKINIAEAFQWLGIAGAGGCPALSRPCCSMEDMVMRSAFDFSPLYRSTVGFDRLFDMLDQSAQVEPMTNWPPYNIEKVGEDQYVITMAIAGFSPDEIELTQKESQLLVVGQKKGSEEGKQYLHRGIATRAFRQTFNLADHVKVVAAGLENGLLTVELKREVPEALKPRRIEINAGAAATPLGRHPQQIEHGKAA